MRVLIPEAEIRARVEVLGKADRGRLRGQAADDRGRPDGQPHLPGRPDPPDRPAPARGAAASQQLQGRDDPAGALIINEAFAPDVAGRDVLLLDDILDTGHTLATLVERMKDRGANSVKTVVLLRKLGRQEVEPGARLLRLHHPRRVRRRLRPGLRRRLPPPALRRGAPGVKVALVTRRYPPLIGGAERGAELPRARAGRGRGRRDGRDLPSPIPRTSNPHLPPSPSSTSPPPACDSSAPPSTCGPSATGSSPTAPT